MMKYTKLILCACLMLLLVNVSYALQVTTEDRTVTFGDPLSIGVDFSEDNIGAIELYLNYDNTKLEYVGYERGQDLAASAYLGVSESNGEIIIAAIDFMGNKINTDIGQLVLLKFNALCTTDCTTSLTFDTLSSIVVDPDELDLAPEFVSGLITIQAPIINPECGDNVCNGAETCGTCPGDCGACPVTCPDGTCDSTETCSSCPSDCGACPVSCGNGACDGAETCLTCALDCGGCTDVCEECDSPDSRVYVARKTGDASTEIMYSSDGTTWGVVDDVGPSNILTSIESDNTLQFGSNTIFKSCDLNSWYSDIGLRVSQIYDIETFNNKLYVATEEADGSGAIYRQDDNSWTQVVNTYTPAKSLAVFNSALYVGTPDTLLKTADGTTWEFVTTNLGDITTLIVYNGKLYAGLGDGTVWSSSDGTDFGRRQVLNTDDTAITSFAIFNNALYAGTTKTNAASIYKYDGSGWWERYRAETSTQDSYVSDFAISDGYIYAALSNDPATSSGGTIIRSINGNTWSTVYSDTNGYGFTTIIGYDYCDAKVACIFEDLGDCVTCGDNSCEAGEDCRSCEEDCGECTEVCGNGYCLEDETCDSCALDCGACQVLPNLEANYIRLIDGQMRFGKDLNLKSIISNTGDAESEAFTISYNAYAEQSFFNMVTSGDYDLTANYVLKTHNIPSLAKDLQVEDTFTWVVDRYGEYEVCVYVDPSNEIMENEELFDLILRGQSDNLACVDDINIWQCTSSADCTEEPPLSEWGACEFEDACTETGIQYRTSYTSVCDNAHICGFTEEQISQECTRTVGTVVEICDNRIDDDCDGYADASDSDCQKPEDCVDNDGDGFGDGCIAPDCNDADPYVYPGVAERCNNQDDDCDLEVDEDFKTAEDIGALGNDCSLGQGICQATGVFVCKTDGTGTVCDALPLGPQVEDCIDGIDNDCDGLIDLVDTDDCLECLNDAACDDGLYCNGVESCDAGKCVVGEAIVCSTSLECATASCNEEDDACSVDVINCACVADVDCDDGNSCTANTCVEGACEITNLANDLDCDDGLFCTDVDRCMDGVCKGSTRSIDDMVECTIDTCNEAGKVVSHVTNNDLCNDNLACTKDVCHTGTGCANTPLTACVSNDGCCPAGCTSTDSDCSANCGDGVCGIGENCLNCLTDCSCGTGQICSSAGICFTTSCIPDCTGKNCGNDGCGGYCGTCAEDYACNTNGSCYLCDVTCEELDYECGTYNFCGQDVVCGKCDSDEDCDDGECVPEDEDNSGHRNSDFSQTITYVYQCNDTLDNDADGKIDLLDPDCTAYNDNSEQYIAPKTTKTPITITKPKTTTVTTQPTTYDDACGDGTCGSSENTNTCPSDCAKSNLPWFAVIALVFGGLGFVLYRHFKSRGLDTSQFDVDTQFTEKVTKPSKPVSRINPSLAAYIRSERAAGFPDSSIRQALVTKGWSATQVDRAIALTR